MNHDRHVIPDAALDADIAILGKKGKGKTYAARGIVERLLDMKRRVLVLDPLSTWWGLRLAADGKREGFPIVVFGGPHADIAINDRSGAALARALVADPIPAVVDLGLMRKAEQARFVADLLDELFAKNRQPLTIVLEEADAFAPQQPMNDMIRVLSEVDRIARRGRAYGFRLISITQRPAKLHKDVLTQLSTLVALGVTSPQDREAIKAWVEGNADRDKAREVYDSLAALPVGEGWVWAPDLDVLERGKFPRLKTLDTSATPKGGEARFEPKALAPVELDRLRKLLAPPPAPEKRPPTGPTLVATKPDPAQLQAAEDRGRQLGFREGHKAGFAEGFAAAVDQLGTALAALRMKAPVVKLQAATAKHPPAPSRAPAAPAPPAEAAADDAPSIGAERKPLAVLARAYPGGLTEAQWATLAGLKRTGGTWSTYRSRLRTAGLIEADGALWRATPLGLAAAGDTPPAAETPEERLAMWRRAVGAAGKLLDILADAHPNAMTRAELVGIGEDVRSEEHTSELQ